VTAETQVTTTSATVDDALFRPVRMGNASEETVERLFQSIRLGVVEAGQRLPSERELAERLGVGRVTVAGGDQSPGRRGLPRVASGPLRRDGRPSDTAVGSVRRRVAARHRRRLRSAAGRRPTPASAPFGGGSPPDGAELDDVLELRFVLETGAVQLAAGRSLSAAT
jgi:DNA-binding transcriptional MocR family regulator